MSAHQIETFRRPGTQCSASKGEPHEHTTGCYPHTGTDAPPPTDTSAGVSAEALARLPSLISGRNTFDRTELRARVGQTVALRLENTDIQLLSFDIDAFDVHVAIPTGKPDLALFTPTTPGTFTFYCGAPGHTEAGTVGTLIFEPYVEHIQGGAVAAACVLGLLLTLRDFFVVDRQVAQRVP